MKSTTSKTRSVITDYSDFVIHAKRRSLKIVDVSVSLSPSGKTEKPVAVSFTDTESQKIQESFCMSNPGQPGRMKITAEEATELGKQLAVILFPPIIFKLFTQSLAAMVTKPNTGLRIRLALDESLVNLPWEYLYRPDRLNSEGISGFLLLDPAISLVRENSNPNISLPPIKGRQQLNFVGTLWEDDKDLWEVKKEYELLKIALKPVSQYISENYMNASELGIEKNLSPDTAIFHYAGHCDFDKSGRGYIMRKIKNSSTLDIKNRIYIDDVAALLRNTQTRLVVLSACNSGFSPIIRPLLKEGIPAIIGINGLVASQSTIEFCTKLYESLSVGLTLDEAVNRARMHVLEWGSKLGLFDWGLYMVYMPSPDAVIFPRKLTSATNSRQAEVRKKHSTEMVKTMQHAEEMDGMNFGEIMSELSKRRVLILGRFTDRRKKILEAIKQHLSKHPNQYIPELFTFEKPDNRDLTESIIGFAALSRFIIADLSEPKSVQSELQAIVPNFLSIPVVSIINKTGRVYATYSSIERRENVIKPSIRYDNLVDLLEKLDKSIVPKAEEKIAEIHRN